MCIRDSPSPVFAWSTTASAFSSLLEAAGAHRRPAPALQVRVTQGASRRLFSARDVFRDAYHVE
eukprot:14814667-Alexandrium_andersonii.AAC.1